MKCPLAMVTYQAPHCLSSFNCDVMTLSSFISFNQIKSTFMQMLESLTDEGGTPLPGPWLSDVEAKEGNRMDRQWVRGM
jgi:hypothetical protein